MKISMQYNEFLILCYKLSYMYIDKKGNFSDKTDRKTDMFIIINFKLGRSFGSRSFI